MSYKIVTTYTKTVDSPENAFKTIPVLKTDFLENVTQEQIDLVKNTYPMQWEMRVVQDQLILTSTYNSKEDYDARSSNPIIQALFEKRKAWAELNKLTFDVREL